MPLDNLFKAMAVRLIPTKVEGLELAINLNFTDLSEQFRLEIRNSVLHGFKNSARKKASTELTMSSLNFKRMISGLTSAMELIKKNEMQIEGALEVLIPLPSYFDSFQRRFPLLTPQPFE